ncbi:MAG: hypothetical protein FJ214_10320 [Ignavibacteria bacterium]|nr:hypothetical protein [Ignavibacteria bacterium]
MPKKKKPRVVVVYNHTGEDVYEKIKDVDPKSLSFKPEYDLDVATVIEEYDAIANAIRKEGYTVTTLNIEENIKPLVEILHKNPPDVVFNLIEHYKDDPKLEYLIAGLFIFLSLFKI